MPSPTPPRGPLKLQGDPLPIVRLYHIRFQTSHICKFVAWVSGKLAGASTMGFIGRLLAALLILGALPFHGLVPLVQVLSYTNDQLFEMLAGADPLVTAYVDAGFWPAVLLAASTLCLGGALVGVLKGERWAASLVFLAAVADAASLYVANAFGLVPVPLSMMQVAGLGAAMVALFLLVRGVTKPV